MWEGRRRKACPTKGTPETLAPGQQGDKHHGKVPKTRELPLLAVAQAAGPRLYSLVSERREVAKGACLSSHSAWLQPAPDSSFSWMQTGWDVSPLKPLWALDVKTGLKERKTVEGRLREEWLGVVKEVGPIG